MLKENGDHFYVEKKDGARAENRLLRRLHVCPALNPEGLHLAVTLEDDGGNPAGRAGINLTPKQARRLRKHIERLVPDA